MASHPRRNLRIPSQAFLPSAGFAERGGVAGAQTTARAPIPFIDRPGPAQGRASTIVTQSPGQFGELGVPGLSASTQIPATAPRRAPATEVAGLSDQARRERDANRRRLFGGGSGDDPSLLRRVLFGGSPGLI